MNRPLVSLLLLLGLSAGLQAEDGYRLWLRYAPGHPSDY